MPWTPPASPINWQDFPSLSTSVNAAHLNATEGYAATVGQSVVDYEETVRPTVLLDTYYDSTAYANKSAAIQAAYAAAATAKAVLECQAGRVYSLDTAPLKLNPATPITIEGRKATLQANWGKPRCIDFTRTADGQTWNNIDVRDLTFDANSLTSATSESIVGNVTGGGGVSTYQRVNFRSIYFRRCTWVNVPVGSSGGPGYSCFDLECSQVFNDQPETQNTITDIRLEQCVMRGGNYGPKAAGLSTGGTAAVNVYLDKIYFDVDHDAGVGATLTTPGAAPTSSYAGANAQIGSLGYGDNCEVHIIGANSTDVGLEIDGMQKADVWGRITDSWNAEFFGRNFHAPPHPASQQMILHSCEARVVNLNPTATGPTSTGFQAGHTATPVTQFGEVVLEDCSLYSAATNLRGRGSAISVPTGALVSKVTIVGTFKAVFDSVSDAAGASNTPSVIALFPGSANFAFEVNGNIDISFAGAMNNSTIIRTVFVQPAANCQCRLAVDEITISSSLTGMGLTNTQGLLLGVPGGSFASGSSLYGRIRRLGWGTFSGGDTTPVLLMALSSTALNLKRLVIDELDFTNDPVAAPALFSGTSGIDTANKAKIAVRSAVMGTYPIASAAMGSTNFASATFTTATGNQYIGGLPAEIHFANGSGAAITAIDVSKDGTTYENAYTQASGAMAQSVLVPVENGDFVKVTFATTQPTTRVRFRRAQ